MFKALANLTTRRPVTVLVAWLLLVALAGVGVFTGFGDKGLFERLRSDSVTVPGTESAEVYDLTQSGDGQGPAVTVVVRGVSPADPAQQATLARLMADERMRLADLPQVESVADPFALPLQDPRAQAFLSRDSDGFVAVVQLAADLSEADEKAAHAAVEEQIASFSDKLGSEVSGASALPLSTSIISGSILDQVRDDLVRGETIGLPIALLLMVLVFGGMIAAGLPLVGALTAIMIGLFGLWGVTHVIDVDSFVLNVVSIIGLALSIDYGLLIVSRFREEAHARLEAAGYPGDGTRLPNTAEQHQLVRAAVHQTVLSAGRTVFFSALTIACAILGLLVMRSPMLRVIGAGGVIVVVMAVLTALTLVPALLTLLGRLLLAPSPLSRVPGLRALFNRFGDAVTEEGMFSALARWVHRHPWAVMLAVGAALVAMTLPLGTLALRNSFADYIPRGSDAKAAYDTVQDDYPALATPQSVLVLDRAPAAAADAVAQVRELEGVSLVSEPRALAGDASRTVVNVQTDFADPVGKEGVELVQELRAWDPGYRVLVGGVAAGQHDFNSSIIDRAPLALAIMVAAVLVLLFLMTGSLVVPLKALVINLLSLAASLGATWFVFEHGLLGLPEAAGLETFVVACTVAFGFGLAMDYEVFLLARIKEYWDAGLSNDEAVEHGLQRSGRIITSAAAIIVAVFMGFVAGDMLAIKQIGVALAIVVVTDATLVRMLLVPATMTLLGRWNWWAPRLLTRFYERFRLDH